MSELIFVYGTLKRGLSNHRHLAGQRFLGEARTTPEYRMVNCGGYPGMFAVEKDGVSVRGEVWEVDDVCRAELDLLEDVAMGLYSFERVSLLPPFEAMEVHTYIYRQAVAGRPDARDEWTEKGDATGAC